MMAPPIVRAANTERWRYKLDQPVGGSGVSFVDVIVVDLRSDTGLAGMGFSYVLAASGEVAESAARHLIEGHVLGQPVGHPEATHRRLRGSLNRSGKGPSYVGLAAIDVALWDLYAKHLDCPLGIAMGGEARSVDVYGSGGFRVGQEPTQAAAQAVSYRDRGIRAVKPRVRGSPDDLPLLDRVRDALGPAGFLAVDANEKGSATTARWLAQVARDYRLLFVEEPLPAHDLAGYRALARAGVSIATGEHLQGLDQTAPFLMEGLCSVIQPDLAMMGGLTECLRVARLAEACGIEVSPHFLPNLFIHLAAAAPNVTWLEDFPLLEPLFGSPETFDPSGRLALPSVAGHGLTWADGARDAFRIG